MMHATTRSPGSVAGGGPGAEVLDLSLTGSQLSVSRRPSSASPGKYFSRSVSVSVATEGKGKRNTLSDASFGISRSVKNLRPSNSTTQVNQQAKVSLSIGLILDAVKDLPQTWKKSEQWATIEQLCSTVGGQPSSSLDYGAIGGPSVPASSSAMWSCLHCTFMNQPGTELCEMCSLPPIP